MIVSDAPKKGPRAGTWKQLGWAKPAMSVRERYCVADHVRKRRVGEGAARNVLNKLGRRVCNILLLGLVDGEDCEGELE